MHSDRDIDRESVFHERIELLKEEGYRGFTVASEGSKGPEIEVTATNRDGRVLSASGETSQEAFEKVIDLIDTALDDSY